MGDDLGKLESKAKKASLVAHYRYSVAWSPEDEEYVATVTEFPSLSWLDTDKEEALRGLERLLQEVVADMAENGEEIPLPFAERKYSGNLKVRVSPEKHRQLAISAQEQGVSLNRYLTERLIAG
ncbi:type II toxin-antitoxin system HicB family antitoxin [Arthrobacter sp. NPDC056727]|uniref:type II toxin-antitoxin system HicB family antitoxin n=1 Tax=Arthrobacter sp. NPDC056727 TaxID=3345927 RepID=UPI0036708244